MCVQGRGVAGDSEERQGTAGDRTNNEMSSGGMMVGSEVYDCNSG